MRDAWIDEELRMQIVGDSDRDVNSRYTDVLEEVHGRGRADRSVRAWDGGRS